MKNKRSNFFNEVAEIYDIARPSYPPELIWDIIKLSDLPKDGAILEVGTGTGQATIPFAEKGYYIHCLEPGNKLIAIASQKLRLYPKVTFAPVTFENWNLRYHAFDLVISAQAFHWVNREIGYPKASQALKEKGHIAFFWNFSPKPDTTVFQALNEAFQKYIPSVVYNPPSIESLIQKRENWIIESKCFKELKIKQYSWSVDYDAEQYLNLLKTQTTYQKITEAQKQDLYNVVVQTLHKYGGYLTKPYLSVLFLAQKI